MQKPDLTQARAMVEPGESVGKVRGLGGDTLFRPTSRYHAWKAQSRQAARGVMPYQRGNACSFGALRGRASNSNTSCFRRTVTAVCPARVVACSTSHPDKPHSAKLCR